MASPEVVTASWNVIEKWIADNLAAQGVTCHGHSRIVMATAVVRGYLQDQLNKNQPKESKPC